ncbi:hypothetical protein IQ218_17640 [Synechocystis salina LEGE 06099]|nr:hypothetical protein [Synechocystis salina LEGE 06099]
MNDPKPIHQLLTDCIDEALWAITEEFENYQAKSQAQLLKMGLKISPNLFVGNANHWRQNCRFPNRNPIKCPESRNIRGFQT